MALLHDDIRIRAGRVGVAPSWTGGLRSPRPRSAGDTHGTHVATVLDNTVASHRYPIISEGRVRVSLQLRWQKLEGASEGGGEPVFPETPSKIHAALYTVCVCDEVYYRETLVVRRTCLRH